MTAGRWSRSIAILVVLPTSACGAPLESSADSVLEHVDFATYCEARDELASIAARLDRTRKQNVSLTFRAPYMPSEIRARGAVAIGPPDKLRMILVGPGGGTALDLWVGGLRWRFHVPAIGKVSTGDASTPPEKRRGLPVDYLSWWMLHPLGGELLWASKKEGTIRFALRDRGAYVEGRLSTDGSVHAIRTSWSAEGEKLDEETIDASDIDCGVVHYTQASTELSVTATCEKETDGAPAKAFVEPTGETP